MRDAAPEPVHTLHLGQVEQARLEAKKKKTSAKGRGPVGFRQRLRQKTPMPAEGLRGNAQ